MRKRFVMINVCVGLLSVLLIQVCPAGIVNGSFEDDGYIDITVTDPNGWSVDMSTVKFGGYIADDWPTDGFYNLTFYSNWYTSFNANDTAKVSQDIYLKDVTAIIFDLRLDAYVSSWNPNKCTAVVMIDDEPVWESDDIRTEYFSETVNVNYNDANMHVLSLCLRVDVTQVLNDFYFTDWDNLKIIIVPCDGNGYLPVDFNYDCYVDINDLELFAEAWLLEVAPVNDPNTKYNLFLTEKECPYGTIDFFDFAIFAYDWDGNIPDLGGFTDVWLQEVDTNHEYNLYKDNDFEPNGIINFHDFAVFGENWMESSYEQ